MNDPCNIGFMQGFVPPCCLCGVNLNGKHRIKTLTTNRAFTICDGCYDKHMDDTTSCSICYRVFLKQEAKKAYIIYPWGDTDSGRVTSSCCPTCAPDGYHCLSTRSIEFLEPEEDRKMHKDIAKQKIAEHTNNTGGK